MLSQGEVQPEKTGERNVNLSTRNIQDNFDLEDNLIYPNQKTTRIMAMQNIGLRTPGVLSIVFGAQGAFLLANAVYTLAYPSAASNLPDSPLAGVPSHTVRCIG